MKAKTKLIFLIILPLTIINPQVLLEENFDYGESEGLLVDVSSGNWVRWAGSNNDFYYNPTSLSYPGYISSGIGGSAKINASGVDDVARSFSQQTSGTVYCSFLLNAQYVTTTTNNYNIHFNSSTSQCAKIFIKKGSATGKFILGLSKTSDTPIYTSSEYDIGTTYLIVISYKINSGSKNDEATLWINPPLDGSLPSPDLTKTDTTNDASYVSSISLRQITSTIMIDGIRVSTSWTTSPLPVELTLFEGIAQRNFVLLKWSTATEINNYGFQIQRRNISRFYNWETIGFVEGHGNSNSPKYYYFIDEPKGGNEFAYKLKQIDYDGTYEYSNEIFVKLDLSNYLELFQNYPNPFNPITKVKYLIPENKEFINKRILIKIYDLLGNEVKILKDDVAYPGIYEVEFDGSNLASGMYIISLSVGSKTLIKKCMLMK